MGLYIGEIIDDVIFKSKKINEMTLSASNE